MYCTHCGAHNPPGSTRCGTCGRPVAPPPGRGTPGGRRCPMCMAVNAPDAVFCAACGARVLPLDETAEAEVLDNLRPTPAQAGLSPAGQLALNLERQRELMATGEDRPVDPNLQRTLTPAPAPSPRPRREDSPPAAGSLSWLDALRSEMGPP